MGGKREFYEIDETTLSTVISLDQTIFEAEFL